MQEDFIMRMSLAGVVALILVVGLSIAGAEQGENLSSPDQKAQQEKAQHSEPGRAGTQEPSSEHPMPKPEDTVALENGSLTAPGAPANSQMVPAKFSERNNALDQLPTLAFPLKLTEEQKQRIRATAGKAAVVDTRAKPADLLPSSVAMNPLPDPLQKEIPIVSNLGFVRTKDRILLVKTLGRVVVQEIPDQPQAK
jgi:hypothetical protein